jgi:anti-sigma-K factor RskA
VNDIDVHHLAAAYALDGLDHREREAFEAHYEKCDVCRTDVIVFRETMAQVADSLAVPPAASLKDRVLADIAVTRQLSPLVAPPVQLASRRVRASWPGLAAAAVLLVVLVVGVIAFTGGGDDSSFNDQLALVLEQPDARMIDLQVQGEHPGTFKVAWSPSMGTAALMGENLPAAPDGKAYELWLVTPEETMAMYVLDPAANGSVHRTFDAPAEPAAWAITMEPEAGVAVATGDIMYLAEV